MAEPSRGGAHAFPPEPASPRIAVRAGRFVRDTRGATSIEYALIAGLIFMIAVGSIRLYSTRMNTVYGQITGAMSQIN